MSNGALGTVDSWTVDAYIREEVRRQGHDIADPSDGGLRVRWMTEAWKLARKFAASRARPALTDIIFLGMTVEPEKNERGLRQCGVRVGVRVCPEWEFVPRLLRQLVAATDTLTPLEWYKEFEMIHPFVDGNGRAGKCLLNWLAKSLDAPFFPPADLFGNPIGNP